MHGYRKNWKVLIFYMKHKYWPDTSKNVSNMHLAIKIVFILGTIQTQHRQ